MYLKRDEFYMWALEVKNIDAAALPPGEQKKLFKDYEEDYNMGILPHERYYNMIEFEQKERDKEVSSLLY